MTKSDSSFNERFLCYEGEVASSPLLVAGMIATLLIGALFCSAMVVNLPQSTQDNNFKINTLTPNQINDLIQTDKNVEEVLLNG